MEYLKRNLLHVNWQRQMVVFNIIEILLSYIRLYKLDYMYV